MLSQWSNVHSKLTLTITSDDRAVPAVYCFDSIIDSVQTQYQEIIVAQHATMGKTLIIDGDVMGHDGGTAYDRAVMNLIPDQDNLRILIMGGGDGSLAKVLAGHHCVKSVVSCELDPQVTEICSKHFPLPESQYFCHNEIIYGDAFAHLRDNSHSYDLVIDDLTVNPQYAESQYSGSGSDYRIMIADIFKNKPIISQTGELGSDAAQRFMNSLVACKSDFCRICRHVESFQTMWTFMRYQL